MRICDARNLYRYIFYFILYYYIVYILLIYDYIFLYIICGARNIYGAAQCVFVIDRSIKQACVRARVRACAPPDVCGQVQTSAHRSVRSMFFRDFQDAR